MEYLKIWRDVLVLMGLGPRKLVVKQRNKGTRPSDSYSLVRKRVKKERVLDVPSAAAVPPRLVLVGDLAYFPKQ